MFIFFAESMLFSFEFRFAKVSFFFPPYYLSPRTSYALGGYCLAYVCGGWGWIELMKEFSFFYS